MMTSCKIALCLVFLGTLGICSAVPVRTTYRPPIATGPHVALENIDNMTPSMQLDASEFLKRAYVLPKAVDRCSMLKQLVADKYRQHKWHVVMYTAYSVQPLRSIVLKATNNNKVERYLLFATKL